MASLVLTGEIHDTIIIDGIRIGASTCLIARTTTFVVGWEWVPYESNEYWFGFLKTLPSPKYVVCDGQKGMLLTLRTFWPKTIIQRCRFHAWLNVKTKLTLNPESLAGIQLLTLARELLHAKSKRQARVWKRHLRRWYRKHHGYIEQRTLTQNPSPGQRTWRYTHYRVRSAYKQLHKITDDLLRSSYRPHPRLPRTTNHVEGGINSQIRTKLKDHRGMPFEHQMKLVEQYLYSRTEAAQIQANSDQKPPRKTF